MDMETKILVIGVIKKDDYILMRKKPDGSPPYPETWYLFGTEPTTDDTSEEVLTKWIKDNLNIQVELKEYLGWDFETKTDLDGKIKRFVYLNVLYNFMYGDPTLPDGAEKLEWINTAELKNYDIVPPAVKLFQKMDLLQS